MGCCTKKVKTTAFILFICACTGFAIVLILVASAQLHNGMPLIATAALGFSIITTICCYDPEELQQLTQSSSGSTMGMDPDDVFRQSAKDNGAVLSGVLVSGGFGINLLLWRYSTQYTTWILIMTIVGNTFFLSAIISVVWIFCFAPRIWDGVDDGTVEW